MIVAQVIDAVIAVRLTRGPGDSSVADAAVSAVIRVLDIEANVGKRVAACKRRRRARDMCG
jgi:hypothetical protein